MGSTARSVLEATGLAVVFAAAFGIAAADTRAQTPAPAPACASCIEQYIQCTAPADERYVACLVAGQPWFVCGDNRNLEILPCNDALAVCLDPPQGAPTCSS